MKWRYLARRLNGDGTETPLHNDLPLTDVDFEKELSGPSGLTATVKAEHFPDLVAPNGDSIFVPWRTVIYAELEGSIRRAGIVTDLVEDGADLSLPCVGFAGYPQKQPFNAEYSGVNADPLNIVRLMWKHLQDKAGGNLGLVIDGTTSKVRVGKPESPEQKSGEEGPFVLGWWITKDIGQEIDKLAEQTPFDYREEHSWVGDTEQIEHNLRIGYPTIGVRRTDLRFVVGENIAENPKVEYDGEDYATGIVMLGAGEGRKMIRGISAEPAMPNRLRRVLTLEDKSLTTKVDADKAAERERLRRQGDPNIKTFTVRNHPSAPLFSYDVGDEIQVKTNGGWNDGLDLWVRILSIATDPQTMTDQLTVIRSEQA